jgi:Arc/MetJ-type ribon-helix-helix transcriptional regulator
VVSTSRKATFSLRAEVLTALDRAVAEGAAPSKNAFVERALVRQLDELMRQERRARWQQAARDPLFMKDVADVEADFRHADAETARRIV